MSSPTAFGPLPTDGSHGERPMPCSVRASHIEGAFAVCNADDLYGQGAFHLIFDQIHQGEPSTEAALVGYTLAKTLSGAGGVARGVCVLGQMSCSNGSPRSRTSSAPIGGSPAPQLMGPPVELTGDEVTR